MPRRVKMQEASHMDHKKLDDYRKYDCFEIDFD